MKQLLLWICVLAFPALAFCQVNEKIVAQATINFDNNKFEIKTSESQKIDAQLQTLTEAFPTYAIEISAFTDSNGSDGFNKKLSYNRAKSLAAYIVKKGFAPQSISFVAHGESNPVAENDSEKGRAENRRASFKIIQNRNFKNSISGFTLKEEFFPIDSEKPNVIKYSSGTELTIPENAFVDKDGNPVTGKVDVNYIEYRDRVDFILGNIPMDYKHNGQDYFFNSAGMFKIGATQGNEEVFLNPQKTIDIDFNLVGDLPDVDFFRFDTKQNIWIKDTVNNAINKKEFVNLDRFLEVSEINPEIDTIRKAATQVFSSTTVVPNKEEDFDCMSFTKNLAIIKAFVTSRDSITSKTSLMAMGYKYINEKKQKTAEFQRSNAQKKKSSLLSEQQKYAIKCAVDAQNGTIKINAATDSYIKRLGEVSWISSAETGTFNLKSCHLLNLEKKSKNLYVLTIKDSLSEKKFDELKVANFNLQKEQMIDNIINQIKNRKIQLKRVDNLIAAQDKVLASKNKLIKYYKKIRYTTKDTVRMYSRLFESFWEFNQDYMASDEKVMAKNEWFQYFDNNKTLMSKRYDEILATPQYKDCFEKYKEILVQREKQAKMNYAQVAVRQKLKINALGIYNCDQIQRLQQPLIVNAEYESKSGEKILPVFIYVVDKNINGILRYDGYGGFSPFRFAYSPTSETTLVAFDANGDAYIYDSNKMKALDKSKTLHKFVVDKIEDISNRAQLESLLN